MEKLSYPLPAKAIEIFKKLLEVEKQQESDYAYLANCCAAKGFRLAKRKFQEKSNSEEGHFDMLTEEMIYRGYEPDVPGTSEPEIEFTDLKSGIKYALELCVETAQLYEKSIREMWEVDLISYNMLLNFLSALSYEIKEWARLYKIFSEITEGQDEREFEMMCFSVPTENALC